MASLEFKQRVKLPEEFFLDRAPGNPRRWPRWPLAVLLWAGFSGLCFGINTGSVPLATWIEAALGEPEAIAASAPATTRRPAQQSPATQPETPSPPAIPTGTAPEDLEIAAPQPGPGLEPDAEPVAALADSPSRSDAPQAAPEPADLARADAADSAGDPQPSAPQPPVALPTPPARASSSSAGTSCDAAVAKYQEEIRIGGPSAPPDLSRSQYAAVLENGSYFSHCGVPDEMSVEICVAVRQGRVLGVTVGTDPGSSSIQSCVARAVRGLSFPSHPRMDVTRTRFAAN